MNIIILTILVVIAVALLVWATDFLGKAGLGPVPVNIIKFCWIVLGVVIVLNAAGILPG